MSLSKGLPCNFERCSVAIHPLPLATLWGGGILVDHWSTISSYFCRIIIILLSWLVYYYWCHLSLGYCWKSCLSRVYSNYKMLWSQGPDKRACGTRLHYLFEMLSVVFVIVIVFELLQPGDQVGSNTWITLKSYNSGVLVKVKAELVSRCLARKTNLVWS